jgi:hypothetical protein
MKGTSISGTGLSANGIFLQTLPGFYFLLDFPGSVEHRRARQASGTVGLLAAKAWKTNLKPAYSTADGHVWAAAAASGERWHIILHVLAVCVHCVFAAAQPHPALC